MYAIPGDFGPDAKLEPSSHEFVARDCAAETAIREGRIYSGGPFAPVTGIRFQEHGDDFGVILIDAKCVKQFQ